MLVSKPEALRQQIIDKKEKTKYGDELSRAFFEQIQAINHKNYFSVKAVEEIMSRQAQFEYSRVGKFPDYPKEFVRFSPSSADKCERELFYKSLKMKQDEQTTFPFQNRWTRNSTAIHGAMQKQLLESMELLNDPKFKVDFVETEFGSLPAWEKAIESWKLITHNGVQFVLTGMMDGHLLYEGKKIGFEFKTKSNSPSQIKQLKEPAPSHIKQCIAYSILFGIDEYLITYEAVAKDKWSSGEDAREDVKVFYYKVTDKERNILLDKFARVTMNVQDAEVATPDYSKCTFCPYKGQCQGDN